MREEYRFIKMIRKGDIDQLKEFLEKNPSFLTKDISYQTARNKRQNSSQSGNALEAAISFNKPEIIKYLVTEKGINFREGRSYIITAAMEGAYEAAVTLLELGADPKQRNIFGQDAYQHAGNQRLKDLLLPYRQELLQEERLAAGQQKQEEHEAAEARIAGIWKLVSPNEVVHQHQPEGKGSITDIFNFSTRHMTSITADLSNGQQPVYSVSFGNVPDQSIIEQASAKFNELTAQQHPKNQSAHGTAPATQEQAPFELPQEMRDAISTLKKSAKPRPATGPRT